MNEALSWHLFHGLLQLPVVILHLFLSAFQGLNVIVQLHHFPQFCINVCQAILWTEKKKVVLLEKVIFC